MKQFTARDGVEIVYDAWGGPSTGPPVVLWRDHVERLAAANRTSS